MCKRIIIYLILILIVWVGACKKETPKSTIPVVPIQLKDTTIVLKYTDTIPVKVSFAAGKYLAFTFLSNIAEARCATCVNGQTDTCLHASFTQVDFQVKDELGESNTFFGHFNSCVLQNDISLGEYFIPFHQQYRIYPIKLAPYPNDTSTIDWKTYTLTLYIRQTGVL